MTTANHDLESADRSLPVNMQEAGRVEAIDDTSVSTVTPRIVSVFQDFKNTSVYMLEFTHKQRDTGDTIVSVDEDFVVRLDSDEEQKVFDDIKKAFSVTDVEMDSQNRILKFNKIKNLPINGGDIWKESVRKDFHARGVLLRWEMVDIGSKAEAVKFQVEKQFSSQGVICELSLDNQKLLLLSQSHDELTAAVNFARKVLRGLAALSDFETPSGIKISVFKSYITLVPADCVISDVDDQLSLSKIKEAAGQQMIEECARYVKEHGRLLVTKVFVSSGGNRWKNVIHARGPRWNHYRDKVKCVRLLTETIFNCLKEASNKGHSTIALPSFRWGSLLMPVKSSAQCYIDAIEKFDKDCGDTTTLQHILFVDVDQDMVSELWIQMYESPTVQATETLRLVLVGKTGVGKSKTGNSILGRKGFTASGSLKSETRVSRMETVVHNDVLIEVVDTPGLFDVIGDEAHADHIVKEILKSVILSLPGPHMFCFCFRADDRVTEAEVEVYQKIQDLFSVELTRYMMAVFTHSPKEGKQSLKNKLKNPPELISKLLNDVNNRVVGIDNKGKAEDVAVQVQSLVKMAIKLRDENSSSGKPFYTNSLVSQCLQLVQSDEFAGQSLEDIKKEVQQSNSRIMIQMNTYLTALAAAIKAQTMSRCNIL